jgi:AcrR family transcriptional regulator
MGRKKTISDADVLRVARNVFREKGHSASTREIAQAAGISEAILYQRFGSKDRLFFTAMHPGPPDVEELLGPIDPAGDARKYLRAVVTRLAAYFGDIMPQFLRLMTHPSFDLASLSQVRAPRQTAGLQEGLAKRLASLARRQRIATTSEVATARLLLSLAHDLALRTVLGSGSSQERDRQLKEMLDVVWQSLRPR